MTSRVSHKVTGRVSHEVSSRVSHEVASRVSHEVAAIFIRQFRCMGAWVSRSA